LDWIWSGKIDPRPTPGRLLMIFCRRYCHSIAQPIINQYQTYQR